MMKNPILLSLILTAFFLTSVIGPMPLAQAEPIQLPAPGVMVHLGPEFKPATLQGLTINPNNALQFDFLIYRGDQALTDSLKKEEYNKLVKYFLASLTVPDQDQWVNLSPYEKNRIIEDNFGKTEMGRDLLAQDYLLKQITSSLIYPEDNLGKKFWDQVYERAWKEFHTTNIPVNTFNKVWIVPDEAAVYESGNTVYVLRNHLKVMLEEDYLSFQKHNVETPFMASPKRDAINRVSTGNVNSIGSQIVREIVLPALEKEVNEGKNFANLRQIYSGMILATWYKHALKESLLGQIYANKAKVKGVNQDDPEANQAIYQQYLKAFKKGVFNYIKEDVDQYTKQPIPRKYFSGGARDFSELVTDNEAVTKGFKDAAVVVLNDKVGIPEAVRAKIGDFAATSENLDRAAFNLNEDKSMMTDVNLKSIKITQQQVIFGKEKMQIAVDVNLIKEFIEQFEKDLEVYTNDGLIRVSVSGKPQSDRLLAADTFMRAMAQAAFLDPDFPTERLNDEGDVKESLIDKKPTTSKKRLLLDWLKSFKQAIEEPGEKIFTYEIKLARKEFIQLEADFYSLLKKVTEGQSVNVNLLFHLEAMVNEKAAAADLPDRVNTLELTLPMATLLRGLGVGPASLRTRIQYLNDGKLNFVWDAKIEKPFRNELKNRGIDLSYGGRADQEKTAKKAALFLSKVMDVMGDMDAAERMRKNTLESSEVRNRAGFYLQGNTQYPKLEQSREAVLTAELVTRKLEGMHAAEFLLRVADIMDYAMTSLLQLQKTVDGKERVDSKAIYQLVETGFMFEKLDRYSRIQVLEFFEHSFAPGDLRKLRNIFSNFEVGRLKEGFAAYKVSELDESYKITFAALQKVGEAPISEIAEAIATILDKIDFYSNSVEQFQLDPKIVETNRSLLEKLGQEYLKIMQGWTMFLNEETFSRDILVRLDPNTGQIVIIQFDGNEIENSKMAHFNAGTMQQMNEHVPGGAIWTRKIRPNLNKTETHTIRFSDREKFILQGATHPNFKASIEQYNEEHRKAREMASERRKKQLDSERTYLQAMLDNLKTPQILYAGAVPAIKLWENAGDNGQEFSEVSRLANDIFRSSEGIKINGKKVALVVVPRGNSVAIRFSMDDWSRWMGVHQQQLVDTLKRSVEAAIHKNSQLAADKEMAARADGQPMTRFGRLINTLRSWNTMAVVAGFVTFTPTNLQAQGWKIIGKESVGNPMAGGVSFDLSGAKMEMDSQRIISTLESYKKDGSFDPKLIDQLIEVVQSWPEGMTWIIQRNKNSDGNFQLTLRPSDRSFGKHEQKHNAQGDVTEDRSPVIGTRKSLEEMAQRRSVAEELKEKFDSIAKKENLNPKDEGTQYLWSVEFILTDKGSSIGEVKVVRPKAKSNSNSTGTGTGPVTMLQLNVPIVSDPIKMSPKILTVAQVQEVLDRKGGIDLNSANLNLQIKRDGKGVPLPISQQDMAALSQIEGFTPKLIEITSVQNLPIIAELQQKLR